jgi:hypothetical protein
MRLIRKCANATAHSMRMAIRKIQIGVHKSALMRIGYTLRTTPDAAYIIFDNTCK